jgi:hypothetical protein
MADAKAKVEKKGTNPLVFVGVGCLVLLVFLGVASSFVMKFFAKRVGIGLLQGAIEGKTGIKTNLQDLEKGKMTFTDTKTGSKVDIGTGKIPDTFPKDFPIYPGAKVTSVMSGSEKGKNNGFWVTLSTADSLDKVASYYTGKLSANGWETTANYSAGGTSTQTVTKGDLSGSLAVTRESDATETQIMIILGTDNSAKPE